jgi:hypothetical protein
MTTQYNTYTREVPHEREYIDDLHVEILKHPSGITVRDLLKGRELVAVLASLQFLLEQGEITENIEPGHSDLLDARKVFPSAALIRQKQRR